MAELNSYSPPIELTGKYPNLKFIGPVPIYSTAVMKLMTNTIFTNHFSVKLKRHWSRGSHVSLQCAKMRSLVAPFFLKRQKLLVSCIWRHQKSFCLFLKVSQKRQPDSSWSQGEQPMSFPCHQASQVAMETIPNLSLQSGDEKGSDSLNGRFGDLSSCSMDGKHEGKGGRKQKGLLPRLLLRQLLPSAFSGGGRK